MKTGFINISEEEYHNDPCDEPSLSASIAHVIDRQSPLHAYTRHPRLGGVPRTHTRAFDMGSLSHALLLGAGRSAAVIDASDYRTKAAQAARDEARASGRIPVLAEEYQRASEVADTLRQRFGDHGIILDGASELVALWVETATDGSRVQCRGMMDHVKVETIYDLKSCRSAHLEACRRHIDEYGYAVQRAAYVSALEKIRPELSGRVDFVFVFYELEPPFAVTPVRLSGQFRELGEQRWKRAVDAWSRCTRTNVWPAYVDSITEIEPMPWAMNKEMDRQIQADGWLRDPPF